MLLEITDLHVAAGDTEIIHGINLAMERGSTHVIFGPNGSGKSTLCSAIMGDPNYTITSGKVLIENTDITNMPPEDRAKLGLFFGFQYPQEIAGVSVLNFLRQALAARRGMDDLSILEVRLELLGWMPRLGVKDEFLDRYLNEGFSGGEKKRHEILQMALLAPRLAMLDETDSGLDIDALAQVFKGIGFIRDENPEMGILAITHYRKVLQYIVPDFVHIMVDGRIVEQGGSELADKLEEQGFGAFLEV